MQQQGETKMVQLKNHKIQLLTFICILLTLGCGSDDKAGPGDIYGAWETAAVQASNGLTQQIPRPSNTTAKSETDDFYFQLEISQSEFTIIETDLIDAYAYPADYKKEGNKIITLDPEGSWNSDYEIVCRVHPLFSPSILTKASQTIVFIQIISV